MIVRSLIAAIAMIASVIALRAEDWQAFDVIILGEVHDNPHAHSVQAEFLQKISPKAIVFEMLGPIEGMVVDGADRSDLAAIEDAAKWAKSGWPPFELYAPVFEAIGDAGIVGAAVPEFLVRQAVSSSAIDVFGRNGARFGLHLPLPPKQQEDREDLQYMVHCKAIPRTLTSGLVEAQRLRDAVFAKVTLDALGRYDAPVVSARLQPDLHQQVALAAGERLVDEAAVDDLWRIVRQLAGDAVGQMVPEKVARPFGVLEQRPEKGIMRIGKIGHAVSGPGCAF